MHSVFEILDCEYLLLEIYLPKNIDCWQKKYCHANLVPILEDISKKKDKEEGRPQYWNQDVAKYRRTIV